MAPGKQDENETLRAIREVGRKLAEQGEPPNVIYVPMNPRNVEAIEAYYADGIDDYYLMAILAGRASLLNSEVDRAQGQEEAGQAAGQDAAGPGSAEEAEEEISRILFPFRGEMGGISLKDLADGRFPL